MMREIKPEELQKNPFQMIGKEWLLVTAEREGKVNAMTASWGGAGIMWNKPVVYIFLRPQRYTKELVDRADTFSLSVLGEEHRGALRYFGSVSGRDEDKIAKAGLQIARADGTPYFEAANTVLICRKLYAQSYDPGCFIDRSLDEKNYPNKDYHTMYIAEIEKVLAD